MIRFWLVLSLVLASRFVAFGDDVNLPTAEEFSVPRVVERLARRVEPELAGKPERLPHYVDFFRSELGNDSRLCAFHVTAKVVDGGTSSYTGTRSSRDPGRAREILEGARLQGGRPDGIAAGRRAG